MKAGLNSLLLCLALAPAQSAFCETGSEAGGVPPQVHGVAMHGAPKYAPDFSHFEYANPDAPKGGHVRRQEIGSFDSLNPFIMKGIAATGVTLLYDTLMTSSADEPFSMYGLLAEKIQMPEDRSWVEFQLRPEARFSDGKPVTAADVVFTFQTLFEKGRPFFKAYYGNVKTVSAVDALTVRFDFEAGDNRELALIVGQMQILPKHYWEGRDFQSVSLDFPIGSGPYVLEKVEAGRSITYKRNPDYWGRELPVNRGHYNFDRLTFDYYRDNTVSLEAFKAGEYDFRMENNSKLWATAYTGPSIDAGLIRTEQIPHENPTGMQGFVFNTRKAQFSDPKVRHALAYAFDFEWTNQNLFYGQYTRTQSYFSNSDLASRGLPSPEELKILEPFRDQLPAEVFTAEYQAPGTDGSGNLRASLAKAIALLGEAGWTVKDGALSDASGTRMEIEILMYDGAFQRVVNPFIQNLAKLGVKAQIRMVDVNQYVNRLRAFEFDMVVASFGQSSSPGNEQREFWGSEFAERKDSRNIIGVKDPVVDALIEQVISAPDREALVMRTRALDRVLLWSHYLIPQWHIRNYRVAYWDKFSRPDIAPKHDFGFMQWWYDETRAARVEAGQSNARATAPAPDSGPQQTDAPPSSRVEKPNPGMGAWPWVIGVIAALAGLLLMRRRAR